LRIAAPEERRGLTKEGLAEKICRGKREGPSMREEEGREKR